jgi:hypothetical protein
MIEQGKNKIKAEYRKITKPDQQLQSTNHDLEVVQAELDDMNIQKVIAVKQREIAKRKMSSIQRQHQHIEKHH